MYSYLQTAECLEEEAQLSLQYSVCDNIDLTTVLQEYESYFYLRYQKQPKICKLQDKIPPGKSEPPKDSKSAKSKLQLPQRRKQSTSSESKPEDISDLMNIQSFQKDDSPEPPSFKEAPTPAAVYLTPELNELSENITREIIKTNFDVKWEDVIGLKKAKQSLQETLVLPLQYPVLFQGILAPWKSVLLYGPPGTGAVILN